jgi:hypothetical protein
VREVGDRANLERGHVFAYASLIVADAAALIANGGHIRFLRHWVSTTWLREVVTDRGDTPGSFHRV